MTLGFDAFAKVRLAHQPRRVGLSHDSKASSATTLQ